MSTAIETIERSEGRQGLASMIRRVKIRNYKSIKSCDVELRLFTILVGRNGLGKSNFLNAIRHVTEGLREPGLLNDLVTHPWAGLARGISQPCPETHIMVEISLDADSEASYEVVMGLSGVDHAVDFVEERLTVREAGTIKAHYHCTRGSISEASSKFMPSATAGRLEHRGEL